MQTIESKTETIDEQPITSLRLDMAGKRASSRVQARDEGAKKAPDINLKGPDAAGLSSPREDVGRAAAGDGDQSLEFAGGGLMGEERGQRDWPREGPPAEAMDREWQAAMMTSFQVQGKHLQEMNQAMQALVSILDHDGQRLARTVVQDRGRSDSPERGTLNGVVVDNQYVPHRRASDREEETSRKRTYADAPESARERELIPGVSYPAYQPRRSPERRRETSHMRGWSDVPTAAQRAGSEHRRARTQDQRPARARDVREEETSDDMHMNDPNIPAVDPFGLRPGAPRTIAQAHAMSRARQGQGTVTAAQPAWKHHKLALYDGSTPLRDYLKTFERVAEVNAWTPAQKCDALVTHLSGSAQQVYTDAPDHVGRDYLLMVRELCSVFEPAGQAEFYQAQLMTRRRGESETWPQLGQAIKRLVRQAYPEADVHTQDRLAREAFVDAIDDRELRSRVRDKEPETLSRAVQVAVRSEAYHEVDKAKGDRGRSRRLVRHVGFDDEEVVQSIHEADVARVVRSVLGEDGSAGVYHTGVQPHRPDSLDRRRSQQRSDSYERRKNCPVCGKEGHNFETCPEVECRNCKENGHIARNCKHPSR